MRDYFVMFAHLIPPQRGTDPSPVPLRPAPDGAGLRLMKAPVAGHHLPQGEGKHPIFCRRPSASCLLLSAYCFPLTAYCFLPSAYCPLLSAFSEASRNKFRGTRSKGPSYRILPASKATILRASAAPRLKS